MPWAILVVGIAATVSTWRLLSAHEHVEISWTTKLASEAIRSDLIEDMEWQRIGLDRLALLWEKAEPVQKLWINNAQLYIQHRPGCVAVEWLAANGDKRSVVTYSSRATALAFDGLPKAAIEDAKRSRGAVYSMPAPADGGAQYAIVYPVYIDEQLQGFVVPFFDAARSLEENLAEVRGFGFSFAVGLPGQPEFILPGANRENEQDWGQTIDVFLPGVTWRLRVWPNPDVLYRIRSAVPEATLIVGVILSLLASVTAYFAVAVARSSIGIRLANEALQREIAVREGTDKELRRARDELDRRVHERTAELATANILLQKEVTEHERAEDALRELTGRVFRMQDEERRHLARELHDGATQDLAALTIDLMRFRDTIPTNDTSTQEVGSGCVRLAQHCTEELRTLSYLLHPPLLNELGLTSALPDFSEGFSTRTGIDIAVNIDPELGRFEPELEVTVFRIVQEALSNIHRHAQSRTAAITLMRYADCLHLEIADAGRGIPPEVLAEGRSKLVGVGITGMRERVRLLGGTLEIQSGAGGTLIRVVLPVCFLSERKAVREVGRASAEARVVA